MRVQNLIFRQFCGILFIEQRVGPASSIRPAEELGFPKELEKAGILAKKLDFPLARNLVSHKKLDLEIWAIDLN